MQTVTFKDVLAYYHLYDGYQGYFRKCGGKSLDNLALSCLFSLPSSSLRYIDIKTKLLFVDPGKGRDGPVSD